jgi:hypothetical protein
VGSAVGASYLIQKQNNFALFGPAPNALTNSFIGIKGTEPIGGNVSVVFALDAGPRPGCGSGSESATRSQDPFVRFESVMRAKRTSARWSLLRARHGISGNRARAVRWNAAMQFVM